MPPTSDVHGNYVSKRAQNTVYGDVSAVSRVDDSSMQGVLVPPVCNVDVSLMHGVSVPPVYDARSGCMSSCTGVSSTRSMPAPSVYISTSLYQGRVNPSGMPGSRVSPTPSESSITSRHDQEVDERDARRRHRQKVRELQQRRDGLLLKLEQLSREIKECEVLIAEAQHLESIRRKEAGAGRRGGASMSGGLCPIVPITLVSGAGSGYVSNCAGVSLTQGVSVSVSV